MRSTQSLVKLIAVALVVGFLLGCIPLGYYWIFTKERIPYEFSRVLAASLTVGITACAAGAALVQYYQNSRATRIERSMSFWRRSNTSEFTENHKQFINHWVRLDKEKNYAHFETIATSDDQCLRVKDYPDFETIARSDDQCLQVKVAVEYLLDFYDEASAAVLMGACDEEAMYFYLGPLMIRHTNELGGFISAWREKHGRQEKWVELTALVEKWKITKSKS